MAVDLLSGLVLAYNCNEGTGTSLVDALGSNNATLTNVTWSTGIINEGITFNGTTSQGEVPHNEAFVMDTALSMSVWVYRTADGQSSTSGIISRGATASSGTPAYQIGLTSTNTIRFVLRIDSTSHLLFSTTTIPLETWTLVTTTYDGSTMRIYINGVVETNTTAVTGSVFGGTHNIGIGAHIQDATNRRFTGTLDGLYLWDRALNQDEIDVLYSSGLGIEHPFVLPSNKIKGYVRIGSTPVSGAIVRLIASDTGVYVMDTTTDVNGLYEFTELTAAVNYHVIVEYENGGTKYNAKSLWSVTPIED